MMDAPIDALVTAALMALCLLTACGVEITPQGAYACDADRACPQGQQCIAGVCLDADALAEVLGTPDATVKVEIVEKIVEKIICPDGACDDANPCTTDTCKDAKCTHAPKEGPCDDGDACTGTKASPDACKAGTCEGGEAKTCDDAKDCTLDGCAPKTGCTHTKLPLACDDGDACTLGDLCTDGTCTGGPKVGCDDANPCTDDGCAPKTGCTHANNTAPCDDGDACTKDDACADGACQPGITLPCECAVNADCAKLDDGNPCTGLVVCGAPGLPGKCTVDAATVPHCDGSLDTLCRKLTCTKAAGGCALVAVADGTSCDDGDACTESDACKGGSCAGAKAKTCDDGKPCTLDLCDGDKGCTHAGALLDGKPCDGDGSVCTESDACKGGTCLPGAATSCDDGEVCTADGCDAKKGCTHVAVKGGTGCDDGDVCTGPDTCAGMVCESGKAKSCPDDGKPCAIYACDPKSGACTKKPASDGTACGEDQGSCSKGACVSTDSAGRKWGLVPAGMFYMGCNATLDKSCNADDEKPQHPVTITKPFWLGVYEVTVSEYKACVAAGTCTLPSMTSKNCSGTYAKWNNWPTMNAGRGSHPVNCVAWSQSQGYCKWAGGSLATEAQWVLASRGRCDENGGLSGCTSKMRVYPWGNTSPVCGTHAVFLSGGAGCGKDRTWAVGTGSASGAGPYGHLDLAGNVWEWVSGSDTQNWPHLRAK